MSNFSENRVAIRKIIYFSDDTNREPRACCSDNIFPSDATVLVGVHTRLSAWPDVTSVTNICHNLLIVAYLRGERWERSPPFLPSPRKYLSLCRYVVFIYYNTAQQNVLDSEWSDEFVDFTMVCVFFFLYLFIYLFFVPDNTVWSSKKLSKNFVFYLWNIFWKESECR